MSQLALHSLQSESLQPAQQRSHSEHSVQLQLLHEYESPSIE